MTPSAPVEREVSFRFRLSFKSYSQTSGVPPRLLMKAILCPSGDHFAPRPPSESSVIRRGAPAVSTSQRSCFRRLAARSATVTVYTIRLPSGEIAGSLTRSRDRNSLVVKRGGAWAEAVGTSTADASSREIEVGVVIVLSEKEPWFESG